MGLERAQVHKQRGSESESVFLSAVVCRVALRAPCPDRVACFVRVCAPSKFRGRRSYAYRHFPTHGLMTRLLASSVSRSVWRATRDRSSSSGLRATVRRQTGRVEASRGEASRRWAQMLMIDEQRVLSCAIVRCRMLWYAIVCYRTLSYAIVAIVRYRIGTDMATGMAMGMPSHRIRISSLRLRAIRTSLLRSRSRSDHVRTPVGTPARWRIPGSHSHPPFCESVNCGAV